MSSCSVGLKTQRLQFQSQNIGTKARHTTIHNPAEPAAHYNFWPMIPAPNRVPGGLPLPAPTPPDVRVRIRRFLAVLADEESSG